MLSRLRTAWGRLMGPLADGLLKAGVTPDQVTIGGTVVSVALALWLFPTGHLFLGSLLLGVTTILDTIDGRSPYRVLPPNASTTGAGQVVSWDRSPYTAAAGIRFFAPYFPGIVVDATPSLSGADVNSIR